MSIEKRKVGMTALEVSAIGLGCNNFGLRIDLERTRAVVDRALALGVTLFDTADRYGNPHGASERFLGQALGERRKNIVLASKFGNAMDDSGAMQGASRRYIKIAVEASLRRLNTDWIDIYQMHRPDPATPIEETLRALEDLVREGKIRCAGCSQFSAAQIREAHATAQAIGVTGLVSAQNQYNLLERGAEREFIPALRECGIGFIPFYPLAGGLLSGKYKDHVVPEGTRFATPRAQEARMLNEERWQILANLHRFCETRGRSMLEVAVNWLLARPGVTSVIAGATTPAQIEQNVGAAGWKLDEADFAELDRITLPDIRPRRLAATRE